MALSQSSKILVSDINSALAGKQDALGYVPVKTVNNVSPDSSGNVTISATPSTVKGVLGSAWAANGTSMTLPSGGTWFVWNIFAQKTSDDGANTQAYGTNTKTGTSSGFAIGGTTYAGGTTVYAMYKYSNANVSTSGKLAAIRIA